MSFFFFISCLCISLYNKVVVWNHWQQCLPFKVSTISVMVLLIKSTFYLPFFSTRARPYSSDERPMVYWWVVASIRRGGKRSDRAGAPESLPWPTNTGHLWDGSDRQDRRQQRWWEEMCIFVTSVKCNLSKQQKQTQCVRAWSANLWKKRAE